MIPQSVDYRLTWPAAQRGVCCIAGQWRRSDGGEVEAWYSKSELEFVLAVMREIEARHDRLQVIEQT